MNELDEPTGTSDITPRDECVRFHLVVGWWSLFVFALLGAVLETMHGYKIGWYLETEHRRLMMTLAHTHGTLLALVHLAFTWTVITLPNWPAGSRSLASRCLLVASVLMPLGFLMGGAFATENDSGIGVYLVPPGALLLVFAVGITALAFSKRS